MMTTAECIWSEYQLASSCVELHQVALIKIRLGTIGFSECTCDELFSLCLDIARRRNTSR